MASITFTNVTVDFPVYSVNMRSFKRRLISVATGGKFGKDRRGRVVVRALDNVSFSLQDGDRVAIIGPNGAGKTTLLRLMTQVYEPSGGQIAVVGQSHSLINVSLAVNKEATGRENIYFRGVLLGLNKKQITDKLDEIIEFTELDDFIDMPVRTYSSGMNLRLAFAVATMSKPQILIMDEWLSVGDSAFKKKARDRLKKLISETSIMVIATHSKQLILDACNRVLWMEHGVIKMDGFPEEIVSKYFNK